MIIKDKAIEPFTITVDGGVYTLQQEHISIKGKNAGKKYVTVVGYYSDFKVMLKHIGLELAALNKSTATLGEYIEYYNRATSNIAEAIKEKGKGLL